MLLDSTTTTRRKAAPAASPTSRADEPLDLDVVTAEGESGDLLPVQARAADTTSDERCGPPP
jgi:hypothetical protein